MVREYVINSQKYGRQVVLLDDEDYVDIISKGYKLHLKYDKTIDGFYVQFHFPDKNKPEKRDTISLHRYIMKCKRGLQVDHINRNPLDNRKCNLRVCSLIDNLKNKGMYKNNKSGHKGVYYINRFKCWIAEFKWNKKCYRSRHCKTMEEAIVARQELIFDLEQKGVVKDARLQV